ncbi:MAG: hypothetical protein ACRD0U_03405 [Acidimicrobiales bacterium]
MAGADAKKILVAAPDGMGGWTATRLADPDSDAESEGFGYSVAAGDGLIVTGSPYTVNDAGYRYQIGSGTLLD